MTKQNKPEQVEKRRPDTDKKNRRLKKCLGCGNIHNNYKYCTIDCYRKNGDVSSRHIVHGLAGSKFYKVYMNIRGRCTSERNISYKNYGGRGIEMRWKSFRDFHRDMYFSYQEYVKKYGVNDTQIDRINNNGHYEKSNCRWVSRYEQCRNKRTIARYTLKEMLEALNIDNRRIQINRYVRLGVPLKEIFKKEVYTKQEAEHKEKIKRLTINANDQAFKYSREIKKLKQQHKEELEKIKAEHEREIKLYQGFLNANGNQINHQLEVRKELEGEINKLKQEHREELQDLLFEIDGFKVGGTREYILQRLESMITKLMNSQKG